MPNAFLAETLQRLNEVVRSVVEGEGFEMLELECRPQKGRTVLRVTIDRLGRESFMPPSRRKGGEGPVAAGIGIADCSRISKAISPVLDVEDLIADNYVLEVSSPGVNRPLKTPGHFKMAEGMKVRVETRAPLEGQKVFTATLVAGNDDVIVLDASGKQIEIPYRMISRANLEFVF